MNATAQASVDALPLHVGAGPGVVLNVQRLVASRLLVQANSGGGKSTTLRALLEQTHGQVQQVIVDPEGEFATLREHFDYVLVGGQGDLPAEVGTARALCRAVMALGVNVILDLYDLPLAQRRRYVREFLDELMQLPREHWHPTLIVIDEIQVFAPERGAGEAESTDAVIALATQGRKRGFALCGATQRLSRLHKDVAAELLNKLIGRTSLDVDLRRAGDELGLDRETRGQLKILPPGVFYAFGPALGTPGVQLVRMGEARTRHPQPGEIGLIPPPRNTQVQDVLGQLLAALAQEVDEAPGEAGAGTLDPVARLEAQVRALRASLQEAEARTERAVQDALLREREALREDLDAALQHLQRSWQRLTGLPGTPQGTPVLDSGAEPTAVPPAPPRRHAPAEESARGALTPPQQRILDALAEFGAMGLKDVSRANVAVWADQSPRSSGFANNLGRLRSEGLIDYPAQGSVQLTEAGRRQARAVRPPASDAELHEAWYRKLTRPQGNILRELVRSYPGSLTREELAQRAGQSVTSSGFANNLGALRSLGLIDYPAAGRAVATGLLFPRRRKGA